MSPVSTRAFLSMILAFSAAAIPAYADDQMTLAGKVTEPNFVSKSFWVDKGDDHTVVFAKDAAFKYNGQDSNIYRLMGTPTVQVSGWMKDGALFATAVNVTSSPSVKLQQSWYTDQATPAFAASELASRGSDTAVAGTTTGATTTTTTGSTGTGPTVTTPPPATDTTGGTDAGAATTTGSTTTSTTTTGNGGTATDTGTATGGSSGTAADTGTTTGATTGGTTATVPATTYHSHGSGYSRRHHHHRYSYYHHYGHHRTYGPSTHYRSLRTRYRTLRTHYRILHTRYRTLRTHYRILHTRYRTLRTHYRMLRTRRIRHGHTGYMHSHRMHSTAMHSHYRASMHHERTYHYYRRAHHHHHRGSHKAGKTTKSASRSVGEAKVTDIH